MKSKENIPTTLDINPDDTAGPIPGDTFLRSYYKFLKL